jgi:hypothetical protein
MNSCCEKAVTEAGYSSGTQMKENVRRWKPLPSNGHNVVTVDISVSVTVRCKSVDKRSL